jgi:signal transduction histidine kinase
MVVQWAAFDYLGQVGISPLRWVVSSITFALRSALCAYYFGLRDYLANSVIELQASTSRLIALRSSALADLADVRARVRAIVVDRVLPLVRELQADLGDESRQMTADRRRGLSRIAETYSQGIVRQASQQVSQLSTDRAVDQENSPPHAGQTPPTERREPLLISIRWSALVFGATLAPLILTAPPDDPGLPILIGICLLLAMLGLGAFVQGRGVTRVRTTLWTVCWTAGSIMIDVGIFAAWGQLPTRLFSPVPLVALMVIIFILAMLAASMERHLRGIATQASELQHVEQEITMINTSLQEDLAAEKRRVALLLHGPVQGRMAAVAMLLKLDVANARSGQASFDTHERAQMILDQVVVDLTDVVDGTRDERIPLPDRLTHLAELWQGIAAVALTSPQQVFDAVARDLVLRTWLYEIVEEGINNAVTHGHATTIDVEIAMRDDMIEVKVRDNGIGGCAEVEPGLGLQMIGRPPARLTLSSLPLGGCELRVTIPGSLGINPH